MITRQFAIEKTAGNDTANFLIGALHDAPATTFKYIQNISQEELDWQPYEGWNTVGALLSHIIAGDYAFKIYFIEKREMTKEEEAKWNPGIEMGKYINELKGKSPEYYQEELMKSFQVMKEAIQQLSTEQLLERRYDVYDKVNGSDLAWTLYHSAEDEVHHRGQISIIRKLYKQMHSAQ